MTRDGGHVLVELLVASACTALVGAGALSLLANGSAAARRSGEWIDGVAVAEACRAVLVADISRAIHGFEGARFIREAASTLRPVSISESRIELLLPVAPTVEVETLAADYFGARAGAFAEIEPGDVVVALPAVGGSAVAGVVAGLESVPDGERIRIDWDPGDVVALPATVRALVAARWREYELPSADEPRIRRRDAGGSWQPVVDGVMRAGFRLTAGVEGSTTPLRIVDSPGALAPTEVLRAVRVACVAVGGATAAGWSRW